MKTKLLLILGIVLALSGCAFPEWQPDAAAVLAGGQPVTTAIGKDPVTARDWACKCHCKSCYQ